MKGCDNQNQGEAGLVPAPGIGQQNLFLRGDGIWASPKSSGETIITETLVYEVEVNSFIYEDHITALKAASIKDPLTKGSIGIIKTLISDNKYQYTAYVYNGTSWVAMDGNYSANSIYFDTDLIVTSPIGVITQEKIDEGSGSITLSTKGKNISEVFTNLLVEEKNPVVNLPSVILESYGNSGEVGEEFDLPTATFKIVDVGSYSYGSIDEKGVRYDSKDTGVVFKAGNVTLTQDEHIVKNNNDLFKDDIMTIQAKGGNIYTDEPIIFSFTADATYSESSERIPISNLGNKVEDLKITTSTINSLSKNVTFTGYRKIFFGSCTEPLELISDNIRSLSNSEEVSNNNYLLPIKEGSIQVIIAIPSSKILEKVKDEKAFGVNIVSEFILNENIIVEGANHKMPTMYNVYTYMPKTALEENIYTITLKNKV